LLLSNSCLVFYQGETWDDELSQNRRILGVRIYGTFSVSWSDGTPLHLRSAKARALMGMLVTSANGQHARSFVQSKLWPNAGLVQRQGNLRRCISELRSAFGEDFDDLFIQEANLFGIRVDRFETLGDPIDGIFLEDVNVREEPFNDWLMERRSGLKRQESARRAVREPASLLPTIAVLPLRIQGALPKGVTAGIGDDLTAAITRRLAQCREIDMISHLSTRLRDISDSDLSSIHSVLGVDFLIYGTLVLSDGDFHLDLDFADARTGKVFWSGPCKGRLSPQGNPDEVPITMLCTRLAGAIYSANAELVQSRLLPEAPVSSLLMSAVTLLHHSNEAGFKRAKLLLDHLINRMPDQSMSRAWRAAWHLHARAQNWSDNPDIEITLARQSTCDALEVNPRSVLAMAMDGYVELADSGTCEGADERFEEATFIDPTHPVAAMGMAHVHALRGEARAAHSALTTAMGHARLQPYRYWYEAGRARVSLLTGDNKLAVRAANDALAGNRANLSSLMVRTIGLQRLGRAEEANKSCRVLLDRHRGLTCKKAAAAIPFDATATKKAWLEALKTAGLPA